MKVIFGKERPVTRRPYTLALAIAIIGFVFALTVPAKSFAAAASGTISLYENPATGEVYLKPGPGRVKVGQEVINQLLNPNAEKTGKQIENLKATEKKLEASLKTVKNESLPSWVNHISLGALVYAGYGYYNNSGFSPSLQLQTWRPAAGNNNYNAFNVNRAYLNFIFHDDNWFLRITPNINRSNNSGGSSSSSGFTAGNEYYRLKYAYLQSNNLYNSNGLSVNVQLGQFTTPIIAWEDGMLGYHMAERTPWGFIGVTSTQAGLGASGTFKANGKVYLDYQLGIFNNAAFHNDEDTDQKSPQARLTFYPLGADSGLNGLGITEYYSWSQGNTFLGITNDNPNVRNSVILSYKMPNAVILGQFDYGINQTSGGFISGSGGISQDAGSWCGIISGSYTCNSAGAGLPFNLNEGSAAVQHNTEHGYDLLGYYNFPHSKWGVFGLLQRFYYSIPDSLEASFTEGNPYDFQRTVIGVGYRLNKYITLALDAQNYQFLNARNYRDLPSGSSGYLNYGQWMGDTDAYFFHVRVAF